MNRLEGVRDTRRESRSRKPTERLHASLVVVSKQWCSLAHARTCPATASLRSPFSLPIQERARVSRFSLPLSRTLDRACLVFLGFRVSPLRPAARASASRTRTPRENADAALTLGPASVPLTAETSVGSGVNCSSLNRTEERPRARRVCQTIITIF